MAQQHATNLFSKSVIRYSKTLNFCCNGSWKWYSKDSDHCADKSPLTTTDEPGSDTQKSSLKGAKFKRRKSLSPLERLGALIAESETDSEINENSTVEKIPEGGLAADNCTTPTTDSGELEQSGNIVATGNVKQRRNVIPSKRLKSMIPDEYWTTESEDTKEIVDNIGSNIDTKDGNKK